MEYLFGFEMAGVIDRAVMPLMRPELTRILTGRFGPSWYATYADPLMQNYKDYGSVFVDETDPLRNFDLSALWFLMFPYNVDEVEDEGAEPVIGAAQYFAEDKGLDRDDLTLIDGLRSLRNTMVHKNVWKRFIAREHRKDFRTAKQNRKINGADRLITTVIYTGPDSMTGQRIIHQDAFDYIERALARLNPSVSGMIAKSRDRILSDLADTGATQEAAVTVSADPELDARYVEYMNTISSFRGEYATKELEWSGEPIGKPLDLPAPWAVSGDDLEGLPWPSLEKSLPADPPKMPDFSQTIPKQEKQDTLKDAAKVAADLGKGLLGSLFGRNDK